MWLLHAMKSVELLIPFNLAFSDTFQMVPIKWRKIACRISSSIMMRHLPFNWRRGTTCMLSSHDQVRLSLYLILRTSAISVRTVSSFRKSCRVAFFPSSRSSFFKRPLMHHRRVDRLNGHGSSRRVSMRS